MAYWVYENWAAESKAVIHEAQCGHCKNGQGCHTNPLGDRNGRWLGPFESIASANIAAEATGKPVRQHACCKKKSALPVSIFTCLLVAACGDYHEPTPLERYPGPWQEEFNVSITKALVVNDIRICGQYKYRESSKDKGEYFVYCSVDGKNWTAYIVWPLIDKVLGPYQPDPTIPVN